MDVAEARIHVVIKKAAKYFKCRVAELTVTGIRGKTIDRMRGITMIVARDVTGASYPELGRAFGGRDHITVLRVIRHTQAQVKTDKWLLKCMKELRELCKEG